ncbi:predicted protein [Histoplasma capsulatum var. duboisii H88]|uniref:Predicted protein n=2 Tax=Ajellomyces capsulatus TaxID=5037 RepID=F0UMM3_AJEC8|nr:predicted protein [Histoplasma capsulatum H143]EGC47340.1 predicted protein [Histoplasma capsulatum var. duboisii H88]
MPFTFSEISRRVLPADCTARSQEHTCHFKAGLRIDDFSNTGSGLKQATTNITNSRGKIKSRGCGCTSIISSSPHLLQVEAHGQESPGYTPSLLETLLSACNVGSLFQ